MKIKLAILDSDTTYLNRIVTAFNTKYADKFEIYSFTNMDMAISSLEVSKIDVLIANNAFEIEVEQIPKRCGFAYFVDSIDVDTFNNQRAICKFQKAELIYKQILSIYSETAGSISGLKLGDDSTKVIAFTSPSGGAGASTMAAACALYFAKKGNKVLYLNLEKFGSPDTFFSAEGQFDMSDVIFALKSKKANLQLKLESCVKQDKSGVCFYSQTKIALDMLELDSDELLRLMSELKLTGTYDYIIVDMDFAIDDKSLKLWRHMISIVWVGEGSEISNTKILRSFNALSIKEQNSDSPLTNRITLIYNKFSNKISKTIGDIGLKDIGGAPRYEHASVEQILSQLSAMSFYDKII